MTDILADIILTVLLLAAIGFGGISLMGLLIFPDIRSRSFTGLRAGILSIALVTAAAIGYGLYSWVVTGGMQYLVFVLISVIAFGIVVVLDKKAADTVCAGAGSPGTAGQEPGKERDKKE